MGESLHTVRENPRWRRHLLPGESAVAFLGLTLALVMMLSTIGSVWWSTWTQMRNDRAARAVELRALSSTLATTCQSMLEHETMADLRRLVVSAAHEHQLETCKVVWGTGQVLADNDAQQIASASRPKERMPVALTAREEVEQDGHLTITAPLMVGGMPSASLQISAPLANQAGMSLMTQIGLGALGVLSLVVLLWLYRHTRKRIAAVAMIREALVSLSQRELALEAMRLNSELGSEAAAWNGLLDEVRDLREFVVSHDAQNLGADGGSQSTDLSAACNAMAQGLILLTSELRIRYANGAAAAFCGQDADTMTSKQLAAVITDEQVLEAATRIVDKSGYSRGIVEVDNRTEEGGSVLRYIARPVRQSDAAALMIIIDDITQQRIAQEAQSSFVAQAAHELRNPLTTIRMVVETAIEDEDQSAEETAEALNIVNSEASRLANIVQDMLNVSEIEAGSLQRKDSDVVMTDIMTRLQRDLEPQAKAKKQQLKMDLPPKYPRLTGDPDKLQVALHNVASNAIKYTPEGGMVTISAEDVSGQLIIRIADTGIGIDPKEAEKIFDRFYRAQDRRLRGITGTGLGLGLARQIIRLHGGDITVESEIDQGSTFSITLPIHEGALMAKG